MIAFSTADLMDEQKCYEFLVSLLHPRGLGCPCCHTPVSQAGIHRHDRVPVLYYHCGCGRIYNAFTGTLWQGTHHSCSTMIRILQGITQGVTTLHLAKELGLDRKHLLERRHQIQALAAQACTRRTTGADSVVEADELYQNAGEKRDSSSRSRRSAPSASQQGSRPRHVGRGPAAGAGDRGAGNRTGPVRGCG